MKEIEENRSGEIVIEGLSASPGIAIGPAFIYQRGNIKVDPQKVDHKEVKRELKSFEEVKEFSVFDIKGPKNDYDIFEIIKIDKYELLHKNNGVYYPQLEI